MRIVTDEKDRQAYKEFLEKHERCNFPALVIELYQNFCFNSSTTLSKFSCFSVSLELNSDNKNK